MTASLILPPAYGWRSNMIIPTPFESLKQAVTNAGGQSGLARICGVAQPTVWKWLQSAKRLPAEYVLRIEQATGVSRHHLRPDIYPVEAPNPARFYGVDFALSPCATAVAFNDRRGAHEQAVA